MPIRLPEWITIGTVPRAYVGCWLWAHVGCEQILFYANGKVAQHDRLFWKSQWRDPLHPARSV